MRNYKVIPLFDSGVDNRPVVDNWDMVSLGVKNYDLLKTLGKDYATLKDAFYSNASGIDATRWCKLYPYQLVICKYTDGSKYVPQPFKFTLPMTPQELSITVPFASVLTITSTGVAEENNGVKIENIQFSGSLGSAPLRGSAKQFVVDEPSFLKTIAAGTIAAVENVKESFSTAVSGKINAKKNHFDEIYNAQREEIAAKYHSTGYVQHLLLDKFLKAYAALKATKEGVPYRLAFCRWKDDRVTLVTPVSYTLKRSSTSPNEYTYDLQLRGWKDVSLDASASLAIVTPTAKAWTLNQALTRLVSARNVIYGAQATIGAVRGDALKLMNTVREVILGVRDMVGVAKSVLDFPKTIAGDFANQIEKEFNNLRNDLESLPDDGRADAARVLAGLAVGGVPGAAVVFLKENPERHATFLDAINTEKLNVSADVAARADAEVARVASFTRSDWEERRDILKEFQDSFASAVGASDVSFVDNYAVVPPSNPRVTTEAEHEVLWAFNDLITETERVLFEKQNEADDEIVASLGYVSNLAAESGVPFDVSISKYPVPFPYGSTLEQLAQIYLGDPDRWQEIATLNGLRAPYVDEIGFDVPVVGVGAGNQISTPSAQNLYINQPVWISGPALTRSKRHILDITEMGGYVVLTLDGESDLGQYSAANGAFLHAFLPDTINSQMMIYIPSNDEPVSAETGDLPIPDSEKYNTLINAAGVDLLLTNDNDLIITPDGDGRWAYGLNHLVQRVRTVLSTPRGSLLRHQQFGIPVPVGTSVADLSKDDLQGIADTLFNEDPAFDSVKSVSIVQNGPTVNIALELNVVGVEQPVAVSVQTYK